MTRRAAKTPWTGGVAAIVVALAACETPGADTQLVVAVDTDIVSPTRVDEIAVYVLNAADAGSNEAHATLVPGRPPVLPVTVAINPDGDPSAAFTVVAVGRSNGQVRVERRVATAFVPHERRLLRLALLERCQPDCSNDRQEERHGPVPFIAPPSTVAQLVTGNGATCVRRGRGTAQCWGANGNSAVGVGEPTEAVLPPTDVRDLRDAVDLDIGAYHACAARADGHVACWGANGRGQLGTGAASAEPRGFATTVVGLDDAVAVAVGDFSSCALRVGGQVACWGSGGNHVLGTADEANRASPVAVAGVEGAVELVVGFSFACVRLESGSVKCWGADLHGQLGDGATMDRASPEPLRDAPTEIVAITAGNAHACALRRNGQIVCWGANAHGQLGDGGTSDHGVAAAVLGVSDAVAVRAGAEHTCALRRRGQIVCWGANDHGQLGDGTTRDRWQPVAVVGLEGAIAIAAGGRHSCADRGLRGTMCWGANARGELGTGAASDDVLLPIATVVQP